VRTILLPNGNVLIPADPADPDDGPGVVEIGPEHPEFGKWLAAAEPGEDPRPGKAA
jgi:hypothetical protein